ncbi:MAG: hypothetical protein SU899_03960 [Chloroflexota bacterium]|nr:hypothetical protein [Chloroflexota bacterium]
MDKLERVLSYTKLMKRHGLDKEELEGFLSDLPSILTLTEEEKTIEVIMEDP